MLAELRKGSNTFRRAGRVADKTIEGNGCELESVLTRVYADGDRVSVRALSPGDGKPKWPHDGRAAAVASSWPHLSRREG